MSTVAPPLFSQQPADAAVTPASGGCLLSRSGRLLRVDVEPACATALHTQHRGGSRTAGSPVRVSAEPRGPSPSQSCISGASQPPSHCACVAFTPSPP
eukprot:32091-Chlamydomonas_euryale.AAC.2